MSTTKSKAINVIVLAAAICLLGVESATAELRAGAAMVSITPPTGTPMAGYYYQRGSQGVIDDLYAKAAVILNVGGMLGGYAVGSIFRMQTACRRTLAIEVGMQNAGLGTVLALAHFGEKGQMVALPAAVFVFVCIITASIAAAIWQRQPPQM